MSKIQQAPKTFEQKVKDIEDNMQVYVDNYQEMGKARLNAFSNFTDKKEGARLFEHVYNKNGTRLFEEFKEGKTFLEKVKEKIGGFLGIKQKININHFDRAGQTPLHYLYNSPEMLKLAVEKEGADINKPNKFGQTVLMKAAEYGKLESIEYLVNKGAPFRIQDIDGKNMLHGMAMQAKPRDIEGQLKAIELMPKDTLEALLSQKDKDGKLPLDYAIANAKPEAQVLIKKMADILPDNQQIQNALKQKQGVLQEKSATQNMPTKDMTKDVVLPKEISNASSMKHSATERVSHIKKDSHSGRGASFK